MKQRWRTAPIHALAIVLTIIMANGTTKAQVPADELMVQRTLPAVARISGYLRSAATENKFHKHGESSGFFFDQGGLLLTVYSVYVKPETRRLCEKFEVDLFDDRSLNARIVAIDPFLNIAILEMLEAGAYPLLPISSAPEAAASETVWAIAGRKAANEAYVFSGRVQAKDDNSLYQRGIGGRLIDVFIEFPDYAYGGPLVNRQGGVLGINMILSQADSSAKGQPGERHAVPIKDIASIYKVLVANPVFEQSWLGIDIRLLTMAERALVNEISQQRGGVFVEFAWHDGPAAKLGVRRGDIIIGMDGERVATTTDFKRLLYGAENDTQMEVKIIRDNQIIREQIRVEKRPPWAAI